MWLGILGVGGSRGEGEVCEGVMEVVWRFAVGFRFGGVHGYTLLFLHVNLLESIVIHEVPFS